MKADAAPAPLTTVFVYGTLMPGERNEHVARHGGATFTAQPATLSGYELIHLHPEGYPGILPRAGAAVQGYALTYAARDWPGVLPHLDALEGLHETPPLYTREQVNLNGDDGPTARAWVYVYARQNRLAQPGVQPVPSGDWRDIQHRTQRGPDER